MTLEKEITENKIVEKEMMEEKETEKEDFGEFSLE